MPWVRQRTGSDETGEAESREGDQDTDNEDEDDHGDDGDKCAATEISEKVKDIHR